MSEQVLDKTLVIRTRCGFEAAQWLEAAAREIAAAQAALAHEDWATAGACAERAKEAAGHASSLTLPLAPGHIGGLQTAEHRLARSPAKRQEFLGLNIPA